MTSFTSSTLPLTFRNTDLFFIKSNQRPSTILKRFIRRKMIENKIHPNVWAARSHKFFYRSWVHPIFHCRIPKHLSGIFLKFIHFLFTLNNTSSNQKNQQKNWNRERHESAICQLRNDGNYCGHNQSQEKEISKPLDINHITVSCTPYEQGIFIIIPAW